MCLPKRRIENRVAPPAMPFLDMLKPSLINPTNLKALAARRNAMDHHTWKKWLLLVTTGVFGFLLLGQSILSTNHWINQPFPGFFVHENLTVAPYFISSWTGTGSGLQSLDRLLTVEDRPLNKRAEIYEIARRAPVGTPIHYQISRGGRTLSYTI